MVPYLKPEEPEIGPSISNFANSRPRAHNQRTAPPIGLYPWPMLAKS
jgi:hypothetical protein